MNKTQMYDLLYKNVDGHKYKEMIKLIEENNLYIEAKECYDPQSGWTGCNYYIKDADGTMITDLSVNGYCFREDSFDDCLNAVKKYLLMKDMNTFDAFKEWVYKNARKTK